MLRKEKCIRHSLSERTGDTDRVRTAGPRSADAPATQVKWAGSHERESEELCL